PITTAEVVPLPTTCPRPELSCHCDAGLGFWPAHEAHRSCPLGVTRLTDACNCCYYCARQEGEACSSSLHCEPRVPGRPVESDSSLARSNAQRTLRRTNVVGLLVCYYDPGRGELGVRRRPRLGSSDRTEASADEQSLEADSEAATRGARWRQTRQLVSRPTHPNAMGTCWSE
ncbi:unnamed protein product, partial [Protopolystoma xenopodis]